MQDKLSSSPTFALERFGSMEVVHLAIVAVLAILTIVGIVHGMKLARRRREATRELEETGHLERTGEVPVVTADVPAVEAAPPPVAPPVAETPPAPIPFAERLAVPDAPVAATATDLTVLKGLGPKVAAMLVDLGIADIAALARLDDAQADAIAGQLGSFAPRMTRDRWLEQARLLAAGDKAGFEVKFGKL